MPRYNIAGSPVEWWGRTSATSPYQPEGEPLLLNAAALSQIPEQVGRSALRAEVGRTDARNGHHLRTHVDGTDARRAEQTPFISQVVDLQGFWIRTRNALSRVSSVSAATCGIPGV